MKADSVRLYFFDGLFKLDIPKSNLRRAGTIVLTSLMILLAFTYFPIALANTSLSNPVLAGTTTTLAQVNGDYNCPQSGNGLIFQFWQNSGNAAVQYAYSSDTGQTWKTTQGGIAVSLTFVPNNLGIACDAAHNYAVIAYDRSGTSQPRKVVVQMNNDGTVSPIGSEVCLKTTFGSCYNPPAGGWALNAIVLNAGNDIITGSTNVPTIMIFVSGTSYFNTTTLIGGNPIALSTTTVVSQCNTAVAATTQSCVLYCPKNFQTSPCGVAQAHNTGQVDSFMDATLVSSSTADVIFAARQTSTSSCDEWTFSFSTQTLTNHATLTTCSSAAQVAKITTDGTNHILVFWTPNNQYEESTDGGATWNQFGWNPQFGGAALVLRSIGHRLTSSGVTGIELATAASTFSVYVMTVGGVAAGTTPNPGCNGDCATGGHTTINGTAVKCVVNSFCGSQNVAYLYVGTAYQFGDYADNASIWIKSATSVTPPHIALFVAYAPSTSAISSANPLIVKSSFVWTVASGATNQHLSYFPNLAIPASYTYAIGVMADQQYVNYYKSTLSNTLYADSGDGNLQVSATSMTAPTQITSYAATTPQILMGLHVIHQNPTTITSVTAISTTTSTTTITNTVGTAATTVTATFYVNQTNPSQVNFWALPLLFILFPTALFGGLAFALRGRR